MAKAHSNRRTLRAWLAALFRQPPAGFYRRPSVYLSGQQMEIEHFEKILLYEENKLCLQLARGRLTIYGDGLRICTLTTTRLTLRGRVLRTDFSDE